jgi:4-amino-4-deoxychorismate lyase
MENPLCPDEPGFRLIETFGYRAAMGVAQLPRHLSRMARSAAALNIPFDQDRARALIGALKGKDKRCRLTLAANGALDLETAPMPAPAGFWTLRLHPQRLNSADPWLHHKSTRRALYDQARAALPKGVDEVLFLNERDELCEGTITNICLTTPQGSRLTPPLAAGCLPGTFRQFQLDNGTWQEATLTKSDLADAVEITLTNALRGAIAGLWDEKDPARN